MDFNSIVAACEYMGENETTALDQGPVVGAARVAYVDAHMEHAIALEGGDLTEINKAWDRYCKAQNAFVTALYS